MPDTVVVESVTRALAGRADVAVALLFGSRARGGHRPDSDVDLAVLGDVDRLRASELARLRPRRSFASWLQQRIAAASPA